MREAWAARAQIDGQVVVRFILSEDEKTTQVASEFDLHQDMVFLQVCPYHTILQTLRSDQHQYLHLRA